MCVHAYVCVCVSVYSFPLRSLEIKCNNCLHFLKCYYCKQPILMSTRVNFCIQAPQRTSASVCIEFSFIRNCKQGIFTYLHVISMLM